MSAAVKTNLEGFHEFVAEKLRNGEVRLTPEQALVQWRERVETIESVQRGLADVEAGRSRPADEVIEELRNEL